jgi:hypothetical protein
MYFFNLYIKMARNARDGDGVQKFTVLTITYFEFGVVARPMGIVVRIRYGKIYREGLIGSQ